MKERTFTRAEAVKIAMQVLDDRAKKRGEDVSPLRRQVALRAFEKAFAEAALRGGDA